MRVSLDRFVSRHGCTNVEPCSLHRCKKIESNTIKLLLSITFSEPLVGFEPTTPRLQITCSGQLS